MSDVSQRQLSNSVKTGIVLKRKYLEFLKDTIQNHLLQQLNVEMTSCGGKLDDAQEVVLVGKGDTPKFDEAKVLIRSSVNLFECTVKKGKLADGKDCNPKLIDTESVSSDEGVLSDSKENTPGSSGMSVICEGSETEGVCTVVIDKESGYIPFENRSFQNRPKKCKNTMMQMKSPSKVAVGEVPCDKIVKLDDSCTLISPAPSKRAKKRKAGQKRKSALVNSLKQTKSKACSESSSQSRLSLEPSSEPCSLKTDEGNSTIVVADDTIVISSESEDDIVVLKDSSSESKNSSPKKKRKKSLITTLPSTSADFIPIQVKRKTSDADPEFSGRKKRRKLGDGFSSETDIVHVATVRPKRVPFPRNITKRGLRNSKFIQREPRENHHSKGESGPKHSYDKNVISANSIDAAETVTEKRTGLRPVIIDGNNVSRNMSKFHFVRLEACIKYFRDRNHNVKAFLPNHCLGFVTDDERTRMKQLEAEGCLCFTPSRKIPGSNKRLCPYDDRFIVQAATELGGVIVSNDNYRDIMGENERWKATIENRLLMYTWVGDMLMFPNDPLGRGGPHLDEFLRFPESE